MQGEHASYTLTLIHGGIQREVHVTLLLKTPSFKALNLILIQREVHVTLLLKTPSFKALTLILIQREVHVA